MTTLAAAVITSIVVFALLIAPFFVGKGKPLVPSSTLTSIEALQALIDAILNQYLKEEKSFEEKVISKLEWKSRRKFLVGRYLDAVRRLDHLQYVNSEERAAE